MNPFLHDKLDFAKKVYFLARPYGRRRLAFVAFSSMLQGLMQVIGVTSIFPFLAVAADPGRIRQADFIKPVLDRFPSVDDHQLLMIAGAFAIGMLVLSNAVSLTTEVIRVGYSNRFGHWMKLRLLNQIVSRPYGYFLQQNSSVLIKKVGGDVPQYIDGILLPLLDGSARLMTIILLTVMLIYFQPVLAMIAIGVLLVFYVFVFLGLGNRRKAVSQGLKATQRGCVVAAQQLFTGVKPIKVHQAEQFFISRFETHSKTLSVLKTKLPLFQNGPRYIVEPVAFGGIVAVVLLYAGRGQDLNTVLPGLGVMTLAGYRMLPAIQLFYGQLSQISASRHSLDEIYDEFLNLEAHRTNDFVVGDGQFTTPSRITWHQDIRLESITFQYPGAATPVIDNFELTIPKNSSLGIVGKTGSGKSTLVDLLLGLHAATAGEILIDGETLTPDNRRAWRAGIGYVPQDIFLTDDTVAANIAFGCEPKKVDMVAVRQAAEASKILDFIENELPFGFATVVGERGVRLSGGQRQRIGLARALYHKPDLLILDEATSALDISTETEVMSAIDSLAGSVTMIIIAHRLSTIQGCDRKLDLHAGTLIAQA